MIEFIAITGERCAVRADAIFAVAEEKGRATITLDQLPGTPIPTDWTYDALLAELKRIEAAND